MNRVVITGLGTVMASGNGKKEFFDNLYSGKNVMKPLPEDYCFGQVASKWYVPYPELDPKLFGRAFEKMYMMSPRNGSSSVASAIYALDDAGLDKPCDDAAVFWGVGAPNMNEIKTAFDCAYKEKPMHPCINPMMMPSAASAWISIYFGIHGQNTVFSTACASGTTAIGHAYEHIRSGKANMAICGGCDCFLDDNGVALKSFDILGAVSSSNDGYPRPFSDERSGFLFSEGGACALILEEYEAALARNADIYAEITGFESCSDGYHIVQMPKTAENITVMLKKLIGDDSIDYYNAHGTGTAVNDKNEYMALKEIFGEKLREVIVNSTKGIIGHTIGASGAVEAAVCAYAIKEGVIHKNITGSVPDDINLPTENVHTDIKTAVSASFGFGGSNYALKFRKVE